MQDVMNLWSYHHTKNGSQWTLNYILLFHFCSLLLSSFADKRKRHPLFRVVSYNVENLFDYRHDTLKNDYEFLPDAVRHWNYTKYKMKLDNIARTITAAGGWTPPALVALCEVENDSVLRDLTRRRFFGKPDTAMWRPTHPTSEVLMWHCFTNGTVSNWFPIKESPYLIYPVKRNFALHGIYYTFAGCY